MNQGGLNEAVGAAEDIRKWVSLRSFKFTLPLFFKNDFISDVAIF